MSMGPLGEEREVKALGGVTIDGAPVTYIVTLAAVVAVLGFIPFSVVLGLGGSFPMSQGVTPLVGWLLGPIAGAIASGIGRTVSSFAAPYTSIYGPSASIWGTAIASFAAGSMVTKGPRSWWWMPLSLLFVVEFGLLIGRATLVNGVAVQIAILTLFVNWSAILLFVLPTRTLFARWIGSEDLRRVTAGLFFGTWMIAGLSHLSVTVILYYIVNWPAEVWATLIPVIPVEHFFRCLIGAVIGVGVIAGLRSIGLVKPTEAIY